MLTDRVNMGEGMPEQDRRAAMSPAGSHFRGAHSAGRGRTLAGKLGPAGGGSPARCAAQAATPTDQASRARRDAVRVPNLKNRALDAAMVLVETNQADRLNLRDIAEAIGAGTASLYYHFKNKDALLADLAAAGFGRLREALIQAQAGAHGRPALQACCAAYLRFVRDHPVLYRVMYDERTLTSQPIARAAEQQAFQAFTQALAVQGDDMTDAAYAVWAFGRGAAALCMAVGEPGGVAGREVAQRIVRGLEALLGYPVRASHHGAMTEGAQTSSGTKAAPAP